MVVSGVFDFYILLNCYIFFSCSKRGLKLPGNVPVILFVCFLALAAFFLVFSLGNFVCNRPREVYLTAEKRFCREGGQILRIRDK